MICEGDWGDGLVGVTTGSGRFSLGNEEEGDGSLFTIVWSGNDSGSGIDGSIVVDSSSRVTDDGETGWMIGSASGVSSGSICFSPGGDRGGGGMEESPSSAGGDE